MLGQRHTLEEFDKWVKDLSPGMGMPKRFGRRMGLEPEEVEYLVARVRQAHNEIVSGKAKAPKPIPDPLKRIENHKHGLYREQGRKCNGCKEIFSFSDMTIDHIIPRSRGGTDALENLQLLCQSCNSSKGAHTQEEWVRGKL